MKQEIRVFLIISLIQCVVTKGGIGGGGRGVSGSRGPSSGSRPISSSGSRPPISSPAIRPPISSGVSSSNVVNRPPPVIRPPNRPIPSLPVIFGLGASIFRYRNRNYYKGRKNYRQEENDEFMCSMEIEKFKTFTNGTCYDLPTKSLHQVPSYSEVGFTTTRGCHHKFF